jgi:hypothetical protein
MGVKGNTYQHKLKLIFVEGGLSPSSELTLLYFLRRVIFYKKNFNSSVFCD